jgi:hypothetical protein
MIWRFQLFVMPKGSAWRVSLNEDGRAAPQFTRECDTRDAAVEYANLIARLLDPSGETSKVWADELEQ